MGNLLHEYCARLLRNYLQKQRTKKTGVRGQGSEIRDAELHVFREGRGRYLRCEGRRLLGIGFAVSHPYHDGYTKRRFPSTSLRAGFRLHFVSLRMDGAPGTKVGAKSWKLKAAFYPPSANARADSSSFATASFEQLSV